MSAQQHGCYLANTRQRCDIRRVFQRQTSAKSCNRAIVSPFSTPPFSSGVPRNLNRSDTQPTRHNQLREKKIPKLRAPRSGTGILKSSTQHVEFHGQERLSRCCADTVSAACTWSKAIHRRSSQSTCPFKFGDTSAKWGADKKSVSKTGDRPAAKLPREFAEQTRKPFRRNGRQETCRGSLQSELQPFQTERHVSARFTGFAGASLPAEASAQAGHRFSHPARWRKAGGKRGLVLRSEATSQSSTATRCLPPLSAFTWLNCYLL